MSKNTRDAIDQILKTDADLNRFCLDYFRNVYNRFSDTMDRVSKINLLMILEDESLVREKLNDEQKTLPSRQKFIVSHSDSITQEKRTAFPPDLPTPILVEKLEQLLLERQRSYEDETVLTAIVTNIDALVLKITEQSRVKAGSLVAGARLIKPLGHGNFGTVWLAKSDSTSRLVATKVFHLDKLAEGVMLWRFRRSIRAMQHLNADHTCPGNINRILTSSADKLAFSMELCSEGNLENIAYRGWTLTKKLTSLMEVCRAVEFAHLRGIIHRDIKPANIVLDNEHKPVLTDFDISDIKFVTKLSMAQGGLGTPVFAAPEQLEEGDQATERADIYSLGRLLYFLLLERSPGYQIEADPSLDNLSGFPSALVAIVRRATQHNPSRRYPSVTAMLKDLDCFNSRWSGFKVRINLIRRWARRNAAILTIFIMIISGTITFAIYQKRVAVREQEYAQKLSNTLEKLNNLEGVRAELEEAKTDLTKQQASIEIKLKTTKNEDEQKRLLTELKYIKYKLEENQRKTLNVQVMLSDTSKEAENKHVRVHSKKPTNNMTQKEIDALLGI